VADLLIAGETYPDGAMRKMGIGHEHGRRLHDDGDARLVVSAKERRAGAGYERFAF
jgi:hypothetical protein